MRLRSFQLPRSGDFTIAPYRHDSSDFRIARYRRVLYGLAFAMALFAAPALADSSVRDETGLMTQNAIAQIDGRNGFLQGNTGTTIGVLVQRGTSDETSLDASTAAQSALSQKFSVLVWVATDGQKTDIVFSNPAIKWVTPTEQASLRKELSGSLKFCCPSDTLPGIVESIATAMENGSKIPADPRNYVRDDLGLLDTAHTASIVAREQQLESATGKGVGVILMQQPAGQDATTVALSDAASLNVKGDVAAVIWVARTDGSLTFSMASAPTYAGSIPDATANNINASFQADMQSGQLSDAIAAAVDRTSAALQASSTPMPSNAPLGSGGASPGVTGATASSSGASSLPEVLVPVTYPPASAPGTSRASTALVLLLSFAIIILIVTMALRRRNR